MTEKKPRIVSIDLGINIESEMEKSVGKPIDTSKMPKRLRPVPKKERDKAIWEERLERVRNLLLENIEKESLVSKDTVIQLADIESTQFNGFMLRLRAYLRRDNEWVIQKKLIKRKPHYYLAKYS
jgi:hypothetical protein